MEETWASGAEAQTTQIKVLDLIIALYAKQRWRMWRRAIINGCHLSSIQVVCLLFVLLVCLPV